MPPARNRYPVKTPLTVAPVLMGNVRKHSYAVTER